MGKFAERFECDEILTLVKKRKLRWFVSLSPDPFFAFLFSFLFVRDTNLAHPIKLLTSLPCLKDLRQNSADRPFNLSLCGFARQLRVINLLCKHKLPMLIS